MEPLQQILVEKCATLQEEMNAAAQCRQFLAALQAVFPSGLSQDLSNQLAEVLWEHEAKLFFQLEQEVTLTSLLRFFLRKQVSLANRPEYHRCAAGCRDSEASTGRHCLGQFR